MSHPDLDAIEKRAKAARGSGIDAMFAKGVLAHTDVPALLARVRELEARLQTAQATLENGIAAADESFRTIEDDADCASTVAVSLRRTANLALSALTTMKVIRDDGLAQLVGDGT